MSQVLRSSIDTFYFGLRIYKEELVETLHKIKNNLFFYDECEVNYYKSRNRFYECSYEVPQYGFFMYFEPRKGCKNDYITIELTGHFFKMISISTEFVNFLLKEFYEVLIWQRVDVALDILYDNIDGLAYEEFSNRLNFPFPDYNDKWHYARLEFETYGRFKDGFHFINMVAVGRGNNRLRVYDKSLDLEEKYNKTYSEYYGLIKDFKYVYRIELQVRGDGLKGIMSKAELVSIFPDCYGSVIIILFSFLFNKFKFSNLDYSYPDLGLNMNTYRRNPDMYKTLNSYKQLMYSFYHKYLNKYDEIKKIEAENLKKELLVRRKIDKKLFQKYIDSPFSKSFNQGYLDFYNEYDRFLKQGFFHFELPEKK